MRVIDEELIEGSQEVAVESTEDETATTAPEEAAEEVAETVDQVPTSTTADPPVAVVASELAPTPKWKVGPWSPCTLLQDGTHTIRQSVFDAIRCALSTY